MVLESTMVCVDSSEYMRNGDYLPTRMQAQQDAVHMICHAKSRANPENNIGLLTTSNSEVLVTLTSESTKVMSHLTRVKPSGLSSFITSLRIAQLALKHRQGKSHKSRVIIFCGSPVTESEADIVKLAKRLKKEKVYVDVINFGEDSENLEKLTAFMNTVNGKDGNNSHLLTISNGPMLSDALVSSPIILGNDKGPAAAFEFGFDPNEDPELALALRVSMEEQRNRQGVSGNTPATDQSKLSTPMETEEDAMLKQALGHGPAITTTGASNTAGTTETEADDLMGMTEEQQIAMAMRMSMAGNPVKMEIDQESANEELKDEKKKAEQTLPSVPGYIETMKDHLDQVNSDDGDILETLATLKHEEEIKREQDDKHKDIENDGTETMDEDKL